MVDALFKIVLFGDAGVGKTALVNRYLTGLFDAQYKITVGVEFHVKEVEFEGNNVKLQIWDFAGESQFRFLLPSYIRGASGGIFIYDITRKSSIDHVSEWFDAINRGIKTEADRFPLLMVGSKSDLEDNRDISQETVSEVAENYSFLDFFECSSKSGQNVEKIFLDISRVMIDRADL